MIRATAHTQKFVGQTQTELKDRTPPSSWKPGDGMISLFWNAQEFVIMLSSFGQMSKAVRFPQGYEATGSN